jgi:CRP-like cAMP-binding protein
VAVASGEVERELAVLEPGAIFGHVALLDHAPASATCRALGPARVGRLGPAAFALLTASSSEIAYGFLQALAEQTIADYRALMTRAADGVTSSVLQPPAVLSLAG